MGIYLSPVFHSNWTNVGNTVKYVKLLAVLYVVFYMHVVLYVHLYCMELKDTCLIGLNFAYLF